jgi:long-chain acyl-CoA synthetase
MLYGISPVRKKLNRIAGKKLMQTFGGELKFFGIGGAKLDKVVEKFLIEARFPYAIGYGLTESSPLLAGTNPQITKWQSTGPAMEGVTLKISNPDPVTGEGEIWAKGPNVMKGYYKEPDLTKSVFSEDGWFKTGDLGIFDDQQFLFIKGRLKNIIIGANGENIYPEEIESVINNFHYVVESLVVQKKGKLVAMVHFNQEEIALRYQHLKAEVSNYVENIIDQLIEELQDYVNSRVNKFSRVQIIILQPVPFKKTPTQKIKRFLYT